MKNFGKLLVASMLTIVLVGCGAGRTREEKVSAMMNKIDEPFFVVSTNLQNLMDKSAVMEEGTIPFTYYQVLTFFLAVELTGIDYSTDVQLVVGEGESFVPNFYGIFKVKNEELFTGLLETEANAEIVEKDGMHYAIKDKEGYCIVWNEEFAIISSIPMDFAAMLSGNGGKQGQKMIDKNIEVIKAAEEGEIDAVWVDFLLKDSDISMRYDGAGFFNYMKLMSMDDDEELNKMKDLYEGMNYDFFIDFNNGSVDFEMIADLSDELKKKLDFMGKKGVDKSLFNYGKSKNPLLTGSYKVTIPGLLDYIEGVSEDDYKGMTEELEAIGLAIEDMEGALSGELVYMIDDVVEREETIDFGYGDPITVSNPEPNFAIVLGVSDRAYIENTMKILMAPPAEGEEVDADVPEFKVLANGVINVDKGYIFLGKDVLFVTNDSVWANKVAIGSTVTINNPKGILNDKPVGLFADLGKVANLKSLAEGKKYLDLLASFSASANLEGGTMQLKLTDDSQNSLKLITKTIGEIMAEFEKESNPDIEAELDEAVNQTESGFDKLNENDKEVIEKVVEDAFDNLNK